MSNIILAAGNFGSPLQLLILLIIIVVLFGSRLPNIGSQIGGAIKGFKKSISDDDEQKKAEAEKLRLEEEAKIIDMKKVEIEKEKENQK